MLRMEKKLNDSAETNSSLTENEIDISGSKNILPYQDSRLSFEERAADLVARMTLEEKAAQVSNMSEPIPRLGVSEYNYWREGLHGVARQGKATSFPTSLAMSNTWNRKLIYKAADITATEARGKNPKTNLSYWSPTINMARDPRWGRNEETYGEDPYLTAQYGIEFVNGMQGDDTRYLKTIATIKHFIANNCEKERRMGSSVMDEKTLREYYGRAFQDIVEKAAPASVMSSYNATTVYRNGEKIFDYIPSTANPYILLDLLRKNWGFNGYVTGDCGAFGDLNNTAAYKKALFTDEDINNVPQYATITKGFLNGADTDCGNAGVQKNVLDAVKNGYITEDDLDINIYRLFLQRMRTGEFDSGVKYFEIKPDVLETSEHVAAAEEAAEQSWVLLKNDNNILPLSNGIKNAALVGNLADEVVLGDYSGSPEQTVTPYNGIVTELRRVMPDVNVDYLGGATDETKLMNIRGLSFILKGGEERKIDLSAALVSGGITLNGSLIEDITRKGTAVFKNIDFSDVLKVRAEVSTGDLAGGKVKLCYGDGGPQVAEVVSVKTNSLNSFKDCIGEYTGTSGGYCGTEDLYLSFEANQEEFSVTKYKEKLDSADVIIAYAGTNLSDSAESYDRKSIDLPLSQSHVQALTSAYPEKTIVAMQTVGQVNVEPFEKDARAIIWTSYNGQTQGTALGKILSGQVNPSGKLTATWYKSEDLELMPIETEGVKGEDGITRYFNDYNIQSRSGFPGRTYQYYSGTPVYPFGFGLSYTDFRYSNIKLSERYISANEKIKISADIENVGTVYGAEIVQLYVSVPGADGENKPKKQLKGFERIELLPGEIKSVSFELDISEMSFFSEKEQKAYVLEGKYKVYIGRNSADESLADEFSVSGELESKLKTVSVLPSGIAIRGLINGQGGELEQISSVTANLSVVMTDEKILDISKAKVSYKSGNETVAAVDDRGVVKSGPVSGVTMITAEVTVNNETKSVEFPIVNILEYKAGTSDKNKAVQELTYEKNFYPKGAFSDNNWNKLEAIYDSAVKEIESAVKYTDMTKILAESIKKLRSVEMDNIENRYTIASKNPNYLVDGIIDYRMGGIPPYITSKDGVSGTVNTENPYHGIELEAYDGNNKIDSKNLIWQIEKLDSSKRDSAEINRNTGELTVMTGGLVRVRVIDISSLVGGETLIYINTQIEAEDSDSVENNFGDNRSGASGSAQRANSTGNTSVNWLEYKGIRLQNLRKITVRYALKSGSVNIKFSVNRSAAPNCILSENILKETGGSEIWKEAVFKVNSSVLYNASVDGNGLSSIFLQANSANIDFFKLDYEEYDGGLPYSIAEVHDREKGLMSVDIKCLGSGFPSGVLKVYASEEVSKEIKSIEVTGGGRYDISTNCKYGDSVSFCVYNMNTEASDIFNHTYRKPAERKVKVYSGDNRAYTVLFCNNRMDKLPEIDCITGYGTVLRREKKKFKYVYGDREYVFSTAWQIGDGSETESCLLYRPKSECYITVLFDGNGGRDRELYIVQGGTILAGGKSYPECKSDVTAKISDITQPVYVYGNGGNKNIYAVFVEYINGIDESKTFETIQSAKWGNGFAKLEKESVTGKTKLSSSGSGSVWSEVKLDYFAKSDVEEIQNPLKINSIDEYKGRLYAGCDNGIMLILPLCQKCYQLKKVCGFDIKDIKIDGGVMNITGDTESKTIKMVSLGSDRVEPEEAMVLRSNGAVLADVREEYEYKESHIQGAVNIPLDSIESLLTYGRNTIIIFYCLNGFKAELAVEKARAMGFENVYNLGGADKLI